MESALCIDKNIDEEIKRVYSSCLRETISIIRLPHNDIHEAIHSSRKNFKFLRALLRLIKYPLGEETYMQLNHSFRDMGRVVSKLRDARVMIVIMQNITTENPDISKDFQEALQELQKQENSQLKAARDQHLFEDITNNLENIDNEFSEKDILIDDFSDLHPGLEDIYSKGREHFQLVQDQEGKGRFHEWRKQVKYLMNAHQILANYWPEDLGISGTDLNQLSDYLGEEHDFTMFSDLLNDESFNCYLGNSNTLKTYVEQKRSVLQQSALKLGESIYSKSGEEFISYFRQS